MSIRWERKTIFVMAAIIIFLVLAVVFCLHLLWPALDPISADMIKIFSCGAAFGLLVGLWLGMRFEREIDKYKEPK